MYQVDASVRLGSKMKVIIHVGAESGFPSDDLYPQRRRLTPLVDTNLITIRVINVFS